MAVLTAGFNPTGATNGASIATSDAGDLTAWGAVTKNGSDTVTYDNTHTLFGKALAGKFVAASASCNCAWTTAYNGATEDFGRLYLYMAALPSGVNSFIVLGYNGGTTDPRIMISTAGKVILGRGSAPTVLATSTTSLSAGQWYRIEWHFVYNATTGSATVDIYTSPDSSTSAETLTATAQNFGTSGQQMVVGPNSTTTWTLWVGQVAAQGTAAVGPYPVNSIAPTVSGSAPVGSTLTAANGTWNGTFNYSYQWTSNGTNIAAATSSTYVTQAGDAGNAIGCTVTAAGQQATNETVAVASSNTITVGASSTSRLALSSHPGRFLRQKGIR